MIIKKFLGSSKSPTYAQIVTEFGQAYQELGAIISLEAAYIFITLTWTFFLQLREILVMNIVNDFTKK